MRVYPLDQDTEQVLGWAAPLSGGAAMPWNRFSPPFVHALSCPFPAWLVWKLNLPPLRPTVLKPPCPFSQLRLWLKINLKPSSLAPLSRSAINWKFRAPCLSCLVQVCATHENRLGHNQRVPCDGKPGLGGPPESPDELQSRSRPLSSHTALDRTQGPQGPEACWVLPSVYTLAHCRAWQVIHSRCVCGEWRSR